MHGTLCRTVFFQRLKAAVQDAAAAGAFRRVDAITEDGVYLHKRQGALHDRIFQRAADAYLSTTILIVSPLHFTYCICSRSP